MYKNKNNLAVIFALLVAIIFLIPFAANAEEVVNLEVARSGFHDVPEASGIIASRAYPDVYWMQSDSDNPAKIYAVDASGHRINSFDVLAINRDWEDIAIDDDNNLWIGDFGDNGMQRSVPTLYKVSEPDPYEYVENIGGTSDVSATAYNFSYPDGPKNVEAIFIWEGVPYLISKASVDANVYKFNELNSSGTVRPELIARFYSGNRTVTGVDISRDGLRLVIVNDLDDIHWVIERDSSSTDIADFFKSPKKQTLIEFSNGGGEGVSFVDGYDFVVISESGGMWRVNQSEYENPQSPSLVVGHPLNDTYYKVENYDGVPLEFSAVGALNCWYKLDGVNYDSSCSVSTYISIEPGNHTLEVFANTSTGVLNVYREFVFGLYASNFILMSPDNVTYITEVPLQFIVVNPLNCWYNLNGVNHNLDCSTFTYLSLQPGNYNITVFANTTTGLLSEYREFSVVLESDASKSIFIQMSKFTGETTNLASMTDNDLANALVVLHVPNSGKIRFLEPINFTKIFDMASYQLQFEGYDYDMAKEVTIGVNGHNVSSLPLNNTAGNNEKYAPIKVDITKFVKSGDNTIVFMQNSGYSKIRNLNISRLGEKIFGNATTVELSGLTKEVSYNFSNDLAYTLNLDMYVNISHYRIEVNTDGLPFMNKSARLVFEHVTLDNPRILKNGVLCEACVLEKYNRTEGLLFYRVPGFSVYTIEETPTSSPSSITGAATYSGGGGGGSGGISILPSAGKNSAAKNDTNETKKPVTVIAASEKESGIASENATEINSAITIPEPKTDSTLEMLGSFVADPQVVMVIIFSTVAFAAYSTRIFVSKRANHFHKHKK